MRIIKGTSGLNHFLYEVVVHEAEKHYKSAMEYFISNRQQVIDEYVLAFQRLCRAMEAQQARDSHHSKVAYIQYSLLFSNVMLHKAPYVIEAFDKDYYLGDVIGQEAYHPQWLFEPLYRFYEEITRESGKYILKITPIEVDRILLIELKKYEEIIKFIAKEAIETLVDTREYRDLFYEDEVEFRIGEFRGESEIIFIKSARNDEIWRYISGVLSD